LIRPKSKKTECPLAWWEEIRSAANLNASSFPLKLGLLHRIIFPERLELSKHWHNPGADVTMTKELIEAYFDKASNRPISGKIDSHVLINSFSDNARMSEGSMQVGVINEEAEEVYGEMLDAGIEQIDMEEDFFFDEDVLEQMTNDGLLILPEEEEIEIA
jgi:hypothetical protein